MSYAELLIGCGHKKEKRIVVPGVSRTWQGLITLDSNPEVTPDLLVNLERLHWRSDVCFYYEDALFSENTFDEIHAYEVLEHLHQQGDAAGFFDLFTTLWRALKPDGYLCATTPSRFSRWLWGDPGHTRAIIQESLVFLDQTNYTAQAGVTSMSDYRYLYKADFKVVHSVDDKEVHQFVLQAIKPARIA